jgi:hypothetical protein
MDDRRGVAEIVLSFGVDITEGEDERISNASRCLVYTS